jgi:hypothetical protein
VTSLETGEKMLIALDSRVLSALSLLMTVTQSSIYRSHKEQGTMLTIQNKGA